MKKTNLSNFGYIMDLLGITAKELSLVIHIDQTSISRWRTGVRKLSVDAPYFDDIVRYLLEKNAALGGDLLEDYLLTVYPDKKRALKSDLKKYIRNYMLNIPNERVVGAELDGIQSSPFPYFYATKQMGSEGRLTLLLSLLDAAKKLRSPSTIKIFEADHLLWLSANMQHSLLFFQKLRMVLDLGHRVEMIVQVKEKGAQSLEINQMFLDLIFHEQLSIYTFSSTVSERFLVQSIYVLSQRIALAGYCFEEDWDNLFNFLTRDRQYVEALEKIWEKLKRAALPISVATNGAEFQHLIREVKASTHRNGAYFFAGKALSIATMSESLLQEILLANHLTQEQMQLCFAFYDMLKDTVESSKPHPMSGFYHILEEICAPLSYSTILNFSLSTIAQRPVQMSRAQYLQHFKDTAELLLRDRRYRVFLHHFTVHIPMALNHPKSLWHKADGWTMIINSDPYSGKTKILYGDDIKSQQVYNETFAEIYKKIPSSQKENEYVADLFLRLIRGERV